MDGNNASTFNRKPIAISRMSGLVLTRRQGEGIRIWIDEKTFVDVMISQIKGKQVRLATRTVAAEKFQIDRIFLEESKTCTSSSVKET